MAENSTPNEQYNQLKHIIHSASTSTLPPLSSKRSSHPHYFEDPEIQLHSARLKTIQLLLNQPASTPFPPGISREDFCHERQQPKKKILDRQQFLHNQRLDGIASRLDNCKKGHSALQFELSRQLLHNKYQPFRLRDELSNQPILTVNSQIQAIKCHYNDFFNQASYTDVQMFTQSANQFIPITDDEVSIAMKRLSNGRTKDFDDLYGEFFKYGDKVRA